MQWMKSSAGQLFQLAHSNIDSNKCWMLDLCKKTSASRWKMNIPSVNTGVWNGIIHCLVFDVVLCLCVCTLYAYVRLYVCECVHYCMHESYRWAAAAASASLKGTFANAGYARLHAYIRYGTQYINHTARTPSQQPKTKPCSCVPICVCVLHGSPSYLVRQRRAIPSKYYFLFSFVPKEIACFDCLPTVAHLPCRRNACVFMYISISTAAQRANKLAECARRKNTQCQWMMPISYQMQLVFRGPCSVYVHASITACRPDCLAVAANRSLIRCATPQSILHCGRPMLWRNNSARVSVDGPQCQLDDERMRAVGGNKQQHCRELQAAVMRTMQSIESAYFSRCTSQWGADFFGVDFHEKIRKVERCGGVQHSNGFYCEKWYQINKNLLIFLLMLL